MSLKNDILEKLSNNKFGFKANVGVLVAIDEQNNLLLFL